MGTSSDGLLIFGIDLGEDWPDYFVNMRQEFAEDDEDMDHLAELFDTLAEAELGIPPYSSDDRPSFKEVEKLRETYPAEIELHCSYDYPMFILAVPGTKRRAFRGYAKEIDMGDLEVPEDSIALFKQYCEERGIEGEPKWLLASMYG